MYQEKEEEFGDENPFKRGKTPRNDPVCAPEFESINKFDDKTYCIITRSRSPSITCNNNWEKEEPRKFYVFECVPVFFQTCGKTVSICDGYVYGDKEVYIIHKNDENNNIITFRNIRNNTYFTLAEYEKIEVDERHFITYVTAGIDVFGANFYYPNYDELLKPFL